LEVCLTELKSKYPDRQEDELINDIPDFLDEVAAALRSDAQGGNSIEPHADGTMMAPAHGVLRKKQGFDLSRLVHDFGLVCDAIGATADRCNEQPSAREFQIVNRCVDNGIATAVESFTADERCDRAADLGMLAHEIRNAASNASVGFELIRQGRASANGMTADVVHRALSRIGIL